MQILNTYILPARGSPPSTAPIAKSRDTLLGCFGFEALVQGYGNRQPKHFLRLSTLGVPIFVQVVFFRAIGHLVCLLGLFSVVLAL